VRTHSLGRGCLALVLGMRDRGLGVVGRCTSQRVRVSGGIQMAGRNRGKQDRQAGQAQLIMQLWAKFSHAQLARFLVLKTSPLPSPSFCVQTFLHAPRFRKFCAAGYRGSFFCCNLVPESGLAQRFKLIEHSPPTHLFRGPLSHLSFSLPSLITCSEGPSIVARESWEKATIYPRGHTCR
jgi:hypothetical protein